MNNMTQSQYRARQVAAKTHEVVEYDHDDSKPGKPLHIMIPGGLVALGALGTIILIAYLTWFETRLDQSTALVLIGRMLGCFSSSASPSSPRSSAGRRVIQWNLSC
mgnify:CR=1 FL=1